MAGPTRDFWESRFAAGKTPWDRGGVSPQLRAWLDAGAVPLGRVCVPGCGAGWEVAELARRGHEVTALDYAPAAVERTRALLEREGVGARVELADVLAWTPERPFDAVYEQTCLCALHPDAWTAYANRLHGWLAPGGVLLGLFMQVPRASAVEGWIEGPPYHCDVAGMRALFPGDRWEWPRPPYPSLRHEGMGAAELAVRLVRR